MLPGHVVLVHKDLPPSCPICRSARHIFKNDMKSRKKSLAGHSNPLCGTLAGNPKNIAFERYPDSKRRPGHLIVCHGRRAPQDDRTNGYRDNRNIRTSTIDDSDSVITSQSLEKPVVERCRSSQMNRRPNRQALFHNRKQLRASCIHPYYPTILSVRRQLSTLWTMLIGGLAKRLCGGFSLGALCIVRITTDWGLFWGPLRHLRATPSPGSPDRANPPKKWQPDLQCRSLIKKPLARNHQNILGFLLRSQCKSRGFLISYIYKIAGSDEEVCLNLEVS